MVETPLLDSHISKLESIFTQHLSNELDSEDRSTHIFIQDQTILIIKNYINRYNGTIKGKYKDQTNQIFKKISEVISIDSSEILEAKEYTSEGTKDIGKDIRLYAVSTYGYCRRALQFLRDSECKFKFIYVDKLPEETKKEVKAKLEEKFDRIVIFPYLTIDNKEVLVGFYEPKWKEKLGL